MLTAYSKILKNSIVVMLITALILSGLFSYPNTAYADRVVLSEQTYYHLDMGVQLAYNPGSSWGTNYYGTTLNNLTATIRFISDVEVIDAYPLESSKGSSFDFNGSTSSHNIPSTLGRGDSAYIAYYQRHVSSFMMEGDCSSSGKNVTFSYDAKLSTSTPLEVVEYGVYGNDDEIWRLFGGKTNLQNNQPLIADAIAYALKAGREGTAGSNKLYLIFCPTVIVYKKYITVGDLEAQLSLPTSAKQGANYIAADASLIDSSLTVDEAVLEKHYGDGNWETVTTWDGTGAPGKNTGGNITEKEDEICTITYRLTVKTTNGQTDTDSKTIQITDGREVDATAILELPEYTYEGHPALATDLSEFEFDGVYYSARRAYEEGVATNKFVPVPSRSGSVSRETKTTANVTFPKAGNYNVRLDVNTADGKSLSDTKPIEVRKTPYIIDRLGGFQKQNRKQILNISVATYPGKPIVDYYIKLRDMKTGEEITLTKDQPQENNATIKTRAHTTSGDQYWTEFTLEFLTKTPVYNPYNPEYTQEFRYSIYMKDSKGDTDSVQKTFTVKPDLPPNPVITIQDSFIRNKGTNIAEIIAEDSSTTDGDQLQRSWSTEGTNLRDLPGYKDLAFGSGQKVQYNKTGVGTSTVKLDVKDVWKEPTLEEYITDADYLSASTTATTDVINIAPTVRLEPLDSEKADVIIVTDKASESGIKAGVNSIKAALIEAGIDANVQVIPTAASNSDGYKRLGSHEWKVAINDPSQQSTGMVFDSEYAYVVEAAGFQVSGYQEVCIPPYTVKALKPGTIEEPGMSAAWSYTVTDSINFRLKLDSNEKYVYLACVDLGKTIILNRKNGAYLTTLPVVIPDNPYTTAKNNNLYFLSGEKIQKYDPDTGTLKTVINKGGTLGRMQNGKITFVGKEDGYRFYIGQFDMDTETVTRKAIPELEEFQFEQLGWYLSSVTPTDLDTTGKVTFTQTIIDNDADIRGIILWLADSETQRIYNLGRVASPWDMRNNSVGFVKDETGKAVYMYHAYSDDDSTSSTTRRYFHSYIYTLGDRDTLPAKRTIYSEKNNRLNWTGISYAKYHSQENAIYLMQGAAWQSYNWGGNVQGVQCRIQLPEWKADFNQYNWGWDIADEEGRWNDSLMMTYYHYENWMESNKRLKLFTNSITKEQAEESTVTRLADYAQDATRYIEKNFNGQIQELIDKVKAAVKEKTSLKLQTGSGGQLSLSKSFNLNPGQTYYYEYEVKKPASENGEGEEPSKVSVTAPEISFDTENIYAGSENRGSYYVTQTYSENFNDAELDPFFTYVNGNLNGKLTTPGTTKGSSNRDISTTATVKVNIPAGKKAIAVMDVAGNLGGPSSQYGQQDTNGWKSGVYINGKRYDKEPKIGFNMTDYVHPYFLKEGENTIQARCYWYGRGDDGYYISIDNLRIMFLEDSTDSSANTFSSSLTGDGWTKVTGSFRTPQQIAEFQSQSMTRYLTWPPAYEFSSDGDNKGFYNFAIPEGMVGRVHATFEGYTSRDSTAGTFQVGNNSFTHAGNRSSLQYVHSGETWFVGDFQGSNRFTATAGYQRYVGFSKLETYVYPENLKGKNSFFFEGDQVYSASDLFKGSSNVTIKLNPGGAANELLLQNLKIYYINNGNKVYLYNKPLQDTAELAGWTISEDTTADLYTETKPEKEKGSPLVYKKGELISYSIFYDDYENDPSKAGYWRYTHTPYNDGPHPDAAVILDEDGNVISTTGAILTSSIPRFYIDGKYTVEHWEVDNTNRTGDISGNTDYTKYDKVSNVESITFYIEGGATAPWITSIKTIPGTVKEGSSYKLQIGVDDLEKEELRLTTELYLDKKLIYTHKATGIIADASGNYPYITTGTAPLAAAGKYEVVCTVRDQTGAGIGTYQFIVVSEGKITGYVNHTEQWELNRKKYNLKRFSDEINRIMTIDEYLAMPTPRPRGTNVFWSGEKFQLEAGLEGDPRNVQVRIYETNAQGQKQNTNYSTYLSNSGIENEKGEIIWKGSLWQDTMINKWGRKAPEELTFQFTATYGDGKTKTHEVKVIIDSMNDFWQLHRLW